MVTEQQRCSYLRPAGKGRLWWPTLLYQWAQAPETSNGPACTSFKAQVDNSRQRRSNLCTEDRVEHGGSRLVLCAPRGPSLCCLPLICGATCHLQGQGGLKGNVKRSFPLRWNVRYESLMNTQTQHINDSDTFRLTKPNNTNVMFSLGAPLLLRG